MDKAPVAASKANNGHGVPGLPLTIFHVPVSPASSSLSRPDNVQIFGHGLVHDIDTRLFSLELSHVGGTPTPLVHLRKEASVPSH